MNIYQKINELKKTITNFTKDSKTEGKGSYTYTSGSQILSAIKSKMEELQLLLLPVSVKHRSSETFDYKTSSGYEKTDFIVQGDMTYEWINAENPEERQKVEFQFYGQQNDISKAFGSGLTYSERYILLKSLGVPTDEEDPDRRTEDKTRNKNARKNDEESETPKVICDRCHKEIKGVKKKDGTIVSAEQVKEKCKGLCTECYKEETQPTKEIKEVEV